ncbi:MAG: PhoH family protein [Candidatus Marinimicrobia bacterium]|nr:PhoH family protein [Candidatus Neomarinimicrobiota bacterium]
MKKTIELKGLDLSTLFGVADAHLNLIEDAFSIKLIARGQSITIDGDSELVKTVQELFHEMAQTLNRKSSLTLKDVQGLIKILKAENGHASIEQEKTIHYGKKGAILPRSEGQEKYTDCIRNNDIVFSIGPAGTGKTYLAVTFAVAALDNHEVDRIVLCRPAVEAGENLGFLPGDLREKVDPYLTPLYDALGDLMPKSRLKPLLEKNIIEVIPLAYMRGRTLDNAFLILDEAQNATTMQMKMFLTRLGVNSKAVITGDITQIDLPKKTESGLRQVMEILNDIDGIGFVYLDETDVVRHQLVRDIILAYDKANGH